MGDTQKRFLPDLVAAIKRVHDEGAEVATASFTHLVDEVLIVFDYLGTVLHFAKTDMVNKNASLKAVAAQLPTLIEVVEADKKAGKATVKDSCARNLHRLALVVAFMRVLLEQLAQGTHVTIREAATAAYEQSLSPIHPYVVRTAVWGGMYVLPSREHFMQQIGETEESARGLAMEFLQRSKEVERAISKLFDGVDMPASKPSTSILSGIWGGGSSTASGSS